MCFCLNIAIIYIFRQDLYNDTDIFDDIEQWDPPALTFLKNGREEFYNITRKIITRAIGQNSSFNTKEIEDLIQLLFEKMNLRLVSAFVKLYAKHNELQSNFDKIANFSNNSNSFNESNILGRNMFNFTLFDQSVNEDFSNQQYFYYSCPAIFTFIYAVVDRMFASKVSRFLGIPQSRWNKLFFPSIILLVRFLILKIRNRFIVNRYENGQNVINQAPEHIEIEIPMNNIHDTEHLHYLYNGAQAIAETLFENFDRDNLLVSQEQHEQNNPFVPNVHSEQHNPFVSNEQLPFPLLSLPTSNTFHNSTNNLSIRTIGTNSSYHSLSHVSEQSTHSQRHRQSSNPFV